MRFDHLLTDRWPGSRTVPRFPRAECLCLVRSPHSPNRLPLHLHLFLPLVNHHFILERQRTKLSIKIQIMGSGDLCKHIYIYVYMYVCMYVCMYECMYVYQSISICIYQYVSIYIKSSPRSSSHSLHFQTHIKLAGAAFYLVFSV